jgi:hypothetical protein
MKSIILIAIQTDDAEVPPADVLEEVREQMLKFGDPTEVAVGWCEADRYDHLVRGLLSTMLHVGEIL